MMVVLLIIALGLVLVALPLIVPVFFFRPDAEPTKYVALLPASVLLTLSFYLLFLWSFHSNEGAPSTVAIVPFAIYALGGVAGLAGLAWLLRFFSLRPHRAYLAVLVFLPCPWVDWAAHQPSKQDLALMKEVEEERQANDFGKKWAEDHPNASDDDCKRGLTYEGQPFHEQLSRLRGCEDVIRERLITHREK